MKVYITRHGETTWNVKNLVCGRPDVELTERGIEQAKSLAEKVQGKGITRILVSPLSRAQITAEYANSIIQVPMETEERLIEHSFGSFEGARRDDPVFQEAKRNITVRFPGGESVLDVAHRIYGLLDEIPHKYPNDTILLVCHGAISRVVHTYFETLPIDQFGKFILDNCELREYTYPDMKR